MVSSFAGATGFLASSDSDAVTVTKEACTLTLSAPANVTAGNPINLTALLDESYVTKGDRSGKTVTFTLVDGAMTSTSVTGTTNAAGSAAASTTVPVGAYAVTASFDGDAYYSSCASGETLATVDPAPVGTAKVTGGGFISDGGRTSFGFVAAASGTGFDWPDPGARPRPAQVPRQRGVEPGRQRDDGDLEWHRSMGRQPWVTRSP